MICVATWFILFNSLYKKFQISFPYTGEAHVPLLSPKIFELQLIFEGTFFLPGVISVYTTHIHIHMESITVHAPEFLIATIFLENLSKCIRDQLNFIYSLIWVNFNGNFVLPYLVLPRLCRILRYLHKIQSLCRYGTLYALLKALVIADQHQSYINRRIGIATTKILIRK